MPSMFSDEVRFAPEHSARCIHSMSRMVAFGEKETKKRRKSLTAKRKFTTGTSQTGKQFLIITNGPTNGHFYGNVFGNGTGSKLPEGVWAGPDLSYRVSCV